MFYDKDGNELSTWEVLARVAAKMSREEKCDHQLESIALSEMIDDINDRIDEQDAFNMKILEKIDSQKMFNESMINKLDNIRNVLAALSKI